MSLVESKRIACGIGINFQTFMERYIDPRWPGTRSLLLIQRNGACIFLEQSSSGAFNCLIHLTKPLSCRRFKASFSHKECLEGLTQRWQLAAGANGELEGDEEKLRDFHKFVASLE